MIKILVLETQVVEHWTMEQVLEEINRDRCDEWLAYDSNDWRTGWLEWVEGMDFYSLVEDEIGA